VLDEAGSPIPSGAWEEVTNSCIILMWVTGFFFSAASSMIQNGKEATGCKTSAKNENEGSQARQEAFLLSLKALGRLASIPVNP